MALPNSSRVLRMGDLPTRIDEEDVISCFTTGDNLVKVNLVKVSEESPDCAGYGYLYFSSVSDAVIAMSKYQNHPIRGTTKRFRLTYVPEFQESPVDEFQVYVGNLAADTTDQELYALFHKDSVHVLNVRIIRSAGNVSRGFGFVQYEKDEFAYKAVGRMQRCTLGNRLIVRETYQRSRVEIERGIECVNNKSIFVGNLNLSIGDVELAKSFERFGTVTASKVVPNRGFGFMSFSDHVAALAALSEMQNTELFHQRIHLAWGRENQQVAPEQTTDERVNGGGDETTSAEFHTSMMPSSKKMKTVVDEPVSVTTLLGKTLETLRSKDVSTEEFKSINELNSEYVATRMKTMLVNFS